jgi:RNA polymerase sigma-70 factor (ECF subfamily)
MDDQVAIERCRRGERDAFRFLVEQYQSQALGHAMAILRNREDALDCVQEAFLDAFQGLSRFYTGRRFYPWFYILLRNRCYKLAHRRREGTPLDEVTLLAPAGENPELDQALHSLGAEERELITLRHLDGLSYVELAERLEIPVGTVMSRLYHARRKMRARLE